LGDKIILLTKLSSSNRAGGREGVVRKAHPSPLVSANVLS